MAHGAEPFIQYAVYLSVIHGMTAVMILCHEVVAQ